MIFFFISFPEFNYACFKINFHDSSLYDNDYFHINILLSLLLEMSWSTVIFC